MRLFLALLAIPFAFASLIPVLGLVALGLVVLASSPAFAATISIPYGDAVAEFASSYAYELLVGGMLFLCRKLPASVYAIIQTLRFDQLAERAIGYGLNAVAGATRGKKLEIEVGSQVLAMALNYAMENAPLLVKWAGGYEALKQKLFARLELVPEASVAKVDQALEALDR